MDLPYETELKPSLYTSSLAQPYANDDNGSKEKEGSGKKTSGPCMDTDLVLLHDPSSTSYIPTTAERQQLREFNNSNTKMIPMIVGVSTSPPLLVSTQQQRQQPMFNVTQQQQTNRRQQRQQILPIISDPPEHHPGRKRTRKMRLTKPRPGSLEGAGVTWQEYTPYPKIGQSLQLEFLSDFDALSMDWTKEENLAHRRLVQFWRVPTTSKIKVCCDFCVLSKDECNNQQRQGCFTAPSDNGRPGVVVMSCITFGQNLWVTSVDLIHLLECIMRITLNIEEKNRIRRNLEGFHPITVSKHEEETVDLFYHVMGFKAPVPRSTGKDVC